MANLTSDEYGEEIRQQIDDKVTRDFSYYGPTFDVKLNAGTAHMNILASDGAAVSLTASLNLGSGIFPPGYFFPDVSPRLMKRTLFKWKLDGVGEVFLKYKLD